MKPNIFKNLLAKKDFDVSAVILTIGEDSFSDAHLALEKQSVSFREIIVIKNISPFSSAFNEGVNKVKTEFFLQCDADMLLDEDCLEKLLSLMKKEVGIVAAYLSDPLQGPTMGVKLYRTELCRKFPHQNRLSCETEFKASVKNAGWKIITFSEDQKKCLGSHRTDLSDVEYLYKRFKLMGAKTYFRQSYWDFTNRFLHLAEYEDKNLAIFLLMSFLYGYFHNFEDDELKIGSTDYSDFSRKFNRLKSLNIKTEVLDRLGYREVFEAGLELSNADGGVSGSIQKLLSYKSPKLIIFLLGTAATFLKNDKSDHWLRVEPISNYLSKKYNYHLSLLSG